MITELVFGKWKANFTSLDFKSVNIIIFNVLTKNQQFYEKQYECHVNAKVLFSIKEIMFFFYCRKGFYFKCCWKEQHILVSNQFHYTRYEKERTKNMYVSRK